MTARTKDKTSRVMKTSNVDINVISATVSATSPVTYLTPDEINALCGALDQAARKFLKKRGFKVGVVVAQLGQPLQAETLYTTEDVIAIQ